MTYTPEKTRSFLGKAIRDVLLRVLSPLRGFPIPLPRTIVKHLQYVGVVTVEVAQDRKFLIESYGANIENHLYWYGKKGHEPETFLPWLRSAKSARVVLDIGANTGLFSLGAGAASPTAKIFTFEPLPRIAQLAQHNASLNPDFDITVVQKAVGESSATATLHDPGGFQPTSASLLADFIDGQKEGINVDVIRIDDFVTEMDVTSVDLIKLDVEGVEEFALRGMQDTIAKYLPDLFVEVLDERPALVEELRRLVTLGYTAYDLRPNSLVPIDIDQLSVDARNLLMSTKQQ